MLSGLSPIVALSVAAAVTSSLQTNVAQRLTWLETVFKFVNLRVRILGVPVISAMNIVLMPPCAGSRHP